MLLNSADDVYNFCYRGAKLILISRNAVVVYTELKVGKILEKDEYERPISYIQSYTITTKSFRDDVHRICKFIL